LLKGRLSTIHLIVQNSLDQLLFKLKLYFFIFLQKTTYLIEEVNSIVPSPSANVPWGRYYKTFFGRNLRIFIISQSVVPGKPFQPSLVFAGKARAYPSEAPFRCKLLASPTNITLDWKGLPGTNTLAYNENP
jgi:hypothetical protein